MQKELEEIAEILNKNNQVRAQEKKTWTDVLGELYVLWMAHRESKQNEFNVGDMHVTFGPVMVEVEVIRLEQEQKYFEFPVKVLEDYAKKKLNG